MQSKKVKIFKIIMLAIFISIMIFLTVKFLPLFKSISTEEGRIELQNEIESIGSEGIIIIVGLMIVQIFLPILPRRTSRNTCRDVLWSNRWTYHSVFRSICKFFHNIFCS